MSQIEIDEAGSDLRMLVQRARGGEEVTLSESGRVLARIVAVEADSPAKPRQLGRLRGRFKVPDDFDRPLPDDLLDMFEGRA